MDWKFDLPKVYADPELVGEAVFQMGHNSVKFSALAA